MLSIFTDSEIETISGIFVEKVLPSVNDMSVTEFMRVTRDISCDSSIAFYELPLLSQSSVIEIPVKEILERADPALVGKYIPCHRPRFKIFADNNDEAFTSPSLFQLHFSLVENYFPECDPMEYIHLDNVAVYNAIMTGAKDPQDQHLFGKQITEYCDRMTFLRCVTLVRQ